MACDMKKENRDIIMERGASALRRLEGAGHEAYFVGGCVRDMLMDNIGPDTDIDIATDALPQEVKWIFHDMDVIDTGIKHGTVTVLLPAGGTSDGKKADEAAMKVLPVEITTYRTEKGYSDGRHPDGVEFTPSLAEDLKRRDFTINAMAMDGNGNITDMFGGRRDIEAGIIRAVGDPAVRFSEDGLRIMRAMRFASVLGFDVERETERAMFENSSMLERLSAERVFAEFCRMLTGDGAGGVVRKYIDVLGVVFPELHAMKDFQQHNEYHRYDVLEHCVRAMEAVRTTPENRLHMKLAALFHDVGKPQTYSQEDNGRGHFYGHAARGTVMMAEIMERFRTSRALAERVETLVKYHDLIFEKDERLLKKWMRRFTPQVLFEILEIKRADNLATGNMSAELLAKFDGIKIMMEDILIRSSCFTLADLAVDGNDIMGLGAKQGPEVGAVLEKLLDAVVEGRIVNDREKLLALGSKLLDEPDGCDAGRSRGSGGGES